MQIDTKTIIKLRDKLKKQDRNFPIPYKVRANIFSSSTGHVTFNPADMKGYSYRWYCLTKRIGSVQVLNSYGYSSTTIKHIWAMRSLFKILGVEYIEIEAPQGLQDLDLALSYNVRRLAKVIVANKYARSNIQSEKHYRDAIKFLRKNKAVFSLLNPKQTVKDRLRLEIASEEQTRIDRLLRQKAIREIRKARKEKQLIAQSGDYEVYL